jgi:DNA-binding MarR family transcriptional regulator
LSREKLQEELIGAVRRSQSATQAYDDAVADYLGIDHTAFRCMDIIQRRGRTTAGELAKESGLTTGAVTAVIDRLERAGYARRVADPSDRRRVVVELTPELTQKAEELYGPLAEFGHQMLSRYNDKQLEMLRDFARAGYERNEQMAADLRSKMDGTGDEAA